MWVLYFQARQAKQADPPRSDKHVDAAKLHNPDGDVPVIMKDPPKHEPPKGVFQDREEPRALGGSDKVSSITGHRGRAAAPTAPGRAWDRQPGTGDRGLPSEKDLADRNMAKAGAGAATDVRPLAPPVTKAPLDMAKAGARAAMGERPPTPSLPKGGGERVASEGEGLLGDLSRIRLRRRSAKDAHPSRAAPVRAPRTALDARAIAAENRGRARFRRGLHAVYAY